MSTSHSAAAATGGRTPSRALTSADCAAPTSANGCATGTTDSEMGEMNEHRGCSTDAEIPADGDGAVPSADPQAPAPGAECLSMYVRLNPRWASAARCHGALTSLMARHPQVEVVIAGVSKDAKGLQLTLGVSLGPVEEIARFSEQATNAYDFVAAIFEVMFDYLPQYAAEPTAEERAMAADLRQRATSAPPHEPTAVERGTQRGSITAAA